MDKKKEVEVIKKEIKENLIPGPETKGISKKYVDFTILNKDNILIKVLIVSSITISGFLSFIFCSLILKIDLGTIFGMIGIYIGINIIVLFFSFLLFVIYILLSKHCKIYYY